jgi:hypothetical protein
LRNKPLLSICLPSYNYEVGSSRIFNFLNEYDGDDIEVIIADNSTTKKINNIFKKLERKKYKISYTHNIPIRPPVDNWNFSLSCVNGIYSTIIHHDEFYKNVDFNNLLSVLRSKNKFDIYILNVKLYDSSRFTTYQHLPLLLKDFLFSHFKRYLYIRNIIGPTGAVVFKSKLKVNFNSKFSWIVDHVWYFSFLKYKYKFLPNINIYSDFDRNDSLTSQIGFKKYFYRIKEDFIYFKFLYPIILFLKLIDSVYWVPFRFLYKFFRDEKNERF